ncbi:protocadherin beta-16-like isoform X29 [Xiphophorus maculatus]|uniref:protocadherin beta-16-like isoform X29 n=1 Tax=Xiphophorus maculatus TaxID=8083 RepID=UPI000C6D5850|nr:protocadherin beta-16-like isoform X29 [Xiphophorus maculatus]
MKRQVLSFLSVLCVSYALGQVSYIIPEEMPKGSVLGNIAHDLGLDLKRLKSGNARVYTGGSMEYIRLNKERGVLVVQEQIDREALCGETTPCALHFQLILENPMELFRVTVEITDINDNSPSFTRAEKRFEISESAAIGSKFILEKAMDSDIGMNGLQEYTLSPTDNFVLKLQNQADGSKKVEMVLQKPLDREEQESMTLLLTATDGGEPQMSGTMQIFVTVLDANDNAPIFDKPLYRAKISENSPKGVSVTTVKASDKDIGSNQELSYLISPGKHHLTEMFNINPKTGEITLTGEIDYEKSAIYQMDIEVVDSGGLSDSTKLIVDVIDENDNFPQINIASKTDNLMEDAPKNTVIAMLSISDPDSESSGKVGCYIQDNVPFKIEATLNGFYRLVTEVALDREVSPNYDITVTCSDEGVPSLSSSVTLTLQISDVNDNAPVFERSSYEAYIVENNTPGVSIFTVKATDADWNQNARVSYILMDSALNGVPVSSYVSVSADSGVIHAVRSFDYEQIKDFQFCIKAQDGGSPPLSSNVTVKMIIQDQNDNPPQVLYPVQTGGSMVAEMVPRSADVGYLVTKVVAVDVDSGQNAWLSYKLQKATDRALFEVGLQNGEIRTIRQVTDKDAVKQRLTVIVEDNGQPSRSATVIVNVAVADSFPEVLSEFSEFPHDKEYNDNLTFYLVLALAVVSFLFITCLVVIISVKIYRWRQSRILYHSSLPVIPYYPPRYSDTLGTGTLPHVYNYEVCRTTDSRKSDNKFGRTVNQNLLIMDPSSTGTMQRIQSEKNILDEPDSPLEQKPPNNDWRFTQGQRPGPSGPHMPYGTHIRWTPKNGTRATGGPEVAMGTGPWPQPPTEAEQLQALMAAANEVSEATATLGPGTMGLSTRYSPQFTLQHVPDYRQNVYIPGSTATLTSNPQQQQATAQQATQQALPPPQASAQAEPPKAAQTPASKKKSTKKEKK